MLKGTLTEMVRKNKLKSSEQSYHEVQSEAERYANYAWQKLKKIFLKNQKDGKSLTIYIGRSDDKTFFLYKIEGAPWKVRLGWRRIKYYEQTLELLCKMAEDVGITAHQVSYYEIGREFKGQTHRFTYNAPSN